MRDVAWDSVAVFRVYLNPKYRELGIVKYSRQYISDIDISDIKTRKELKDFLISWGFNKIPNQDAESPHIRHFQFNPRMPRKRGLLSFDKKIGSLKLMSQNIVFDNENCIMARRFKA